jgi:serine protease Do
MKQPIAALSVNILAGIAVGVVGGLLALQVFGGDASGSTDSTPEGGLIPVSDADWGGGPPGVEDPLTTEEIDPMMLFQEEARRYINEALGEGRRTAIVNAAEQVRTTVVTVFVEEERPRYRSIFDPWASYDPGPVRGLGSGVIISSEGYILTNDHVVGNADKITVRLADGRQLEGVVVDTDPRHDMAVLKIDPPEDIPVARLGDSSDILIGEWVIALGSPFGFELEDPQPSVSVGVVSAVGRSFITRSDGEDRYFPSTIQTDASINPGNSGGPLVNALGEVIGINSFILSQSGGSVGIAFAIPINQVKQALDQIQNYGRIRKAWTGLMTVQNSNSLIYRNPGIKTEPGIVVFEVEADSPALEADIKPGALIVMVNGEEMRSNRDFETLLLKAQIGDVIDIEYYPFRSNRRRSATITVGEKMPD